MCPTFGECLTMLSVSGSRARGTPSSTDERRLARGFFGGQVSQRGILRRGSHTTTRCADSQKLFPVLEEGKVLALRCLSPPMSPIPSHASPSPFGWSAPRRCIVSCRAAGSADGRASGTARCAQDPARIKRLRVIDFIFIVRHSVLAVAVCCGVQNIPHLRRSPCFPVSPAPYKIHPGPVAVASVLVSLLHSGPVSQRFVSVLRCSSAPRLGTADSCGFTGLRWVSLRPCRVVVIWCPTASHSPTGR